MIAVLDVRIAQRVVVCRKAVPSRPSYRLALRLACIRMRK